jgi:hypothetical protein
VTDLPTDPLLAGHTRKNALSPTPDHDPRRVIVFTCKIIHQKLMKLSCGDFLLITSVPKKSAI